MIPTKSIVYIVHSVDSEGPMYESLSETFKRVEQVFGLSVEHTEENLKKLQAKTLDFNGNKERIARMVAPDLLNYNDDYRRLDEMLHRIGSEEFRYKITDSFGGGWVYNWHCVDHVGYTHNIRRKDIGFHNIFDHYKHFIDETNAPDKIYWHFHPSHPHNISNLKATLYFRNSKIYDIIARRIIERDWFPSVNRAGYHTERPDSHWFLEQWVPFDLSNQSFQTEDEQAGANGARFEDWRRAPLNWSVYNPDHDDYQLPGLCRRYIGRCLNMGTGKRCINAEEMEKAFQYARDNGSALMGITNHDFLEMSRDIDLVRNLAVEASKKFPDVDFKFSDAREAFNKVIFGDYVEPAQNILEVSLTENIEGGRSVLEVNANEEIFGPQPFLAIETKDGSFFHDNFDFEVPFKRWSYTFDFQTFPIETVNRIGVATNDRKGFYHIKNLELN